MKTKLTITWALAVAITLMQTQYASAQLSLKRGDKPVAVRPVLPQEVTEAIADIEAQAAGSTLLVECNGAFGYSTIQSAVEAAEVGDTVVVLPRNAFGFECDGDAYVENINFLGKPITVQNLIPTNPEYVETTIIDGDQFLFVMLLPECGQGYSVVDGLTIVNGQKGIFAWGSSVKIQRCVVSGNSGYGISCRDYPDKVAINDCLISENGGTDDVPWGGGIQLIADANTSCEINNCVIYRNANLGSFPASAGVSFLGSGELTINKCIISDNSSHSGEGGGIRFWWGFDGSSPNLTVNHCIISRNSASFFGGGINIYRAGDVTLNNCIIRDNSADLGEGGGILIGHTENARFSNCLISENKAFLRGGGLYTNNNSNLRLDNCTVTANSATYGGGIFSDWDSSLTISNSIFWGDTAGNGNGSEIAVANSSLQVDYSDIEGGQERIYTNNAGVDWGCGNIKLDPGFVDPENGDYHLTLYSLARNAGDPDFEPEEGETDIDGDPRVQEGRVDMGADEFVLHEPSPAELTALDDHSGLLDK